MSSSSEADKFLKPLSPKDMKMWMWSQSKGIWLYTPSEACEQKSGIGLRECRTML